MSSPSAQAAPVPPDLPTLRLAALRNELDRIDDALHDALMRRAEVVAQVGALGAKAKVPVRPGREAAIIRRLLARNRGPLRPAMVVRIWREIIAGFTLQQEDLRVAVDDAALAPMAGAHFALPTPVHVAAEAEAVMRRMASGEANVAVLRWPGAWWTALVAERAASVHVVARLPFWGAAAVEAMVLTQAAPDPSGDDRTLIGAKMGGAALVAALEGAGLSGRLVGGTAAGPSLVETDGFIMEDDARLGGIAGVRVLGAYATQIGVTG